MLAQHTLQRLHHQERVLEVAARNVGQIFPRQKVVGRLPARDLARLLPALPVSLIQSKDTERMKLPVTVKPVAPVGNTEEVKRALQRAIRQVSLRAPAPDAADILSPCISICRMSATTAWCEGCFRTGDEIAAWGGADAGRKRVIWNAITQRMRALQA